MIKAESKAIQMILTFKGVIAQKGEENLNKKAMQCAILAAEEALRQLEKSDIATTKKALSEVHSELKRFLDSDENVFNEVLENKSELED